MHELMKEEGGSDMEPQIAADVLASSESSDRDEDKLAEPPLPLLREIAFVATVCSAQLLTQAGLGQVIAPLHIIGASFDVTSPAQLSWYAAAYSLTVGTFILPSGRLGDVYGHKKIFVIGYIWYGLWSLIAGFSIYVNSNQGGHVFFSICRAFQGIGPALLLPNALALLGRTYPDGRRKHMMFSLFGGCAPTGFVLGAVFSSLFSQKASWPWAYWTMGIFCVGMAALSFLTIPKVDEGEFRRTISRGGVGWKARWNHLDAPGMITGVCGLVLINFAWNQGPVIGWSTPYVYVLLIIGILIISGFFYIEHQVPNPLVPVRSLSRDTLFVLGCIAAGWSSFGIWVFYLWQFLELERHVTPLLGSAMLAPTAISGLTASIVCGYLLGVLGPPRIMLLSMTAFCLGNILLATAPVHQIYWAQTFVSILITPWGMDMSFPSATIVLSNSMRREDQGVAASLINTVVNYSISIGLGIAGLAESKLNDEGRNLLKGYRVAWYVAIGLAGMGILIATLFVILTRIRPEKKEKVINSA
ncbi:Drug resistance protein [Phlyctema vagabunda]|uniref:Drug resistance protein n=1 Tax=Phlyctema vagabunda TaxID=108571 RepID=A0ABR4PMX3_9HELO